jgi:voltage-gated potassium channel
VSELRQLRGPVVVLMLVLTIGTAGYVGIEGWPVLDALYMTVTTIATVGFGEIHPLSPVGRLFTIGLIFSGVGGALYTLTAIVQYVFEGHLGRTWERRRMQQRIDRLDGHFILCGYGRVGRQVARDFRGSGTDFVVIDVNQDSLDRAEGDGHLCVRGDATSDETLRAAGIDRARGLVTCMNDDADNIFVTLSGRTLRSDLFIVARGNNEDARPKLERAGADRVVSPYSFAGRQMAMLAVRPTAVEFVETVLHGADVELLLEDVSVAERSPLVGCTIEELQKEVAPGVVVLAIGRGGRLLTQPPPETDIRRGDELVAFGTPDQLKALEGAA